MTIPDDGLSDRERALREHPELAPVHPSAIDRVELPITHVMAVPNPEMPDVVPHPEHRKNKKSKKNKKPAASAKRTRRRR